jgi:protein-S-isoprenylcysteine O-methyltransferase Ste14
VVSGFYHYVRNPIYTGVVTAIAGEALLFWRRGIVIELVTVWVAMHLFVWLYEEPKLVRTYPVEYPIYCGHVRRWLPRITPWDGSAAT